ncbi:DUF262 domain-containing protein [Streptococcus dysgalactiae]|uniref:DUF262 domain-containing protein n=3 Tax=Streptococcus dysgalactiae TaxID=1334 RepID=A0AB38Y1A7_STREQ|nr:DUF262 domain-containing protein [Streptococcus dysgalactiae]OBZ07301.1 hypothetical protein BBG02_00170 [Streptococcus dysgalactiae subsp. equisimilis]QQC49872.1 DUF262 domain-containing protein [Streptococcus dysgalactiae]QQY17987.1 DUF262 domain-containing protein [Streptococcus dysgalactiae]TYK96297.1 DUF262 domain-containing protein [Streptococcus dysgalactiae]TYL00892.1 DUF262 domain-containing protein [Streptococcus dysgalactiae]
MAFTTETRAITDIFQRSVQYSIPRYQRNYVWRQVNWRELIVDIRFSMDNGDEIPWSHFLGTIVLNKMVSDKGIDRYEIIDGQQRLTTIYILIISIFGRLKQINEESAKNRANYIYDSFITSLNNESKRCPVIKNEDFDDDIKEIIDHTQNSKKNKLSKSNNYYKLYSYFESEFRDKSYTDISNFIDKLLSANIVEIISGQEEEIYNIFEVLNARGQKLKQIELLKNHIMKYVQPRDDEFIDQARKTWRSIEEAANNLSNSDSLIQSFAKCYIKRQAENIEGVYRLIKEEVSVDSLSEFLSNLKEYTDVYVSISNKDASDATIEYFNIKRNQQIRPLLTAISLLEKRGTITCELKNEAFKILRNYFFTFNTFRLSSNKMESLITTLSFDIYHVQYAQEFKMYLSRFLYDAQKVLPDGDVKNTFIENKTFRFSNKDDTLSKNRSIVRYILASIYKLDQYDTDFSTNSLTIEHLIGDDGYTDNSLIQNLTLTTSNINSDELQNKDIRQKLDILKKQSTIKKNQQLEEYWIDNNGFDFLKRKSDLLDLIFDNVFRFDTNIFNLTKNDVDEYFNRYEKILKIDNKELLEILRQQGKNFYQNISNDPKLSNLRRIYDSIDNLSKE